MSEKDKLLKSCVEVLKRTRVESWYNNYLLGKNQGETINTLINGLTRGQIGVDEALSIAFVAGYQWSIKFEGVK